MQGRELRRSVTLLDQLAVSESYHPRDLLRVGDEDDVRAGDRREDSAGRTLLDIIREEHVANGAVVNGNSGSGINWKSFKDLLRLRHAASSSVQSYHRTADPEVVVSVRPNPVLARSISIPNCELPLPESTSVREAIFTGAAVPTAAPPVERQSSGVDNEEATDGGESTDLVGAIDAVSSATGAAAEEEQPVRISLMALLEQADRQWGEEGSSPEAEAAALAAALAEEGEGVAEEGGGGGMLCVCCVCLVRNKGAAFIPCGHTFCRLCSRELWVGRGNCPLCNTFILEILDIF